MLVIVIDPRIWEAVLACVDDGAGVEADARWAESSI